MDSCVLFVKQKTAYEMRISDWSSDVGSSDLVVHRLEPVEIYQQQRAGLRLAAMAFERAFEQIGDVAPVRQAGQRVIARQLVDLALRPLLVGQVGAAAAKPLELAEFIADRLAGNRPPAFLAGHRRLHRQFLERRARRQAEPQRALLALVPADALADDVGKGMAEQMGERPVEARRDGRRNIDEPPFAIGFPEPAAPHAFEIEIQKIARTNVRTQVSNAHLVCRLRLEKKNNSTKQNNGA